MRMDTCLKYFFQIAGHLVITNSPDREQRDKYTLKIRAVKTPEVSEREVPVFFYTLYVQVWGNCKPFLLLVFKYRRTTIYLCAMIT